MTGGALSSGQAAVVLFGTFFTLFMLRVPVAFALGLACLPILAFEPRLSPMMLLNETFKAYNSFILLAVPFYLLTASLMNTGGVTDRLVRLFNPTPRVLQMISQAGTQPPLPLMQAVKTLRPDR